jgi:predicted AlkP superfamily phosphohydrolase/phosphomutase
MGRVIVIGIDGMDYSLTKEFLPFLPNFSELSRRGSLKGLASVFPADSIPSWITIYTGLAPETHGVIRSIDYLNKNYKKLNVNTEPFQGRTFWDEAGNRGKKVCIINPFMAYPVWPVKGVMVSGPVFMTGEAQCYPEEVGFKYGLPEVLGGIVDFPTKKTLQDFINKTFLDTNSLAGYALNLFKLEEWDLFFVTFLTLDRIQHFLWRFCDRNDPTYPGPGAYENVIKEAYIVFDKILGRFLASIGKDDQLIIISDHGHGMRCTRHLNLNEFLRQKGYLRSSARGITYFNKDYWVQKAKQLVLQGLFTMRQEDLTYRIARFVPNRKELKKSEFIINDSDSIARLSDFAGSGHYGGIDVSNEIRGSGEHFTVLNKIICDLEALNAEHKGSLFKWIKMSDTEPGKKNPYPDVIFELYPPYGVNWDVFTPLITRNPFHRKISGGHNSTGVLFSNGLLPEKGHHVRDIKSMVLKGLGIGDD